MTILAFFTPPDFQKDNVFLQKPLSASPVCLSVNRQSRFEDEYKNGVRIEQTLFTL
jgi:hypothetical protein